MPLSDCLRTKKKVVWGGNPNEGGGSGEKMTKSTAATLGSDDLLVVYAEWYDA